MRAHADFPPSSAQRNCDCPASWALNRNEPDTENLDSALGTFAHHIGEMCLTNETDAHVYLGHTTEVTVNDRPHTLTCDAEMVAGVQQYVDWCRENPGLKYAEMRLDISRWTPMKDQFGTSDHVTVTPDWFSITDLKYGKERVDAQDNLQLVEYALGVYDWFKEFFDWNNRTKVVLRVCQPRLDHFDTWEIDVGRLIEIGTWIKERYILAMRPDAPFGPSKKACRWCKVRDRCIPLREFLHEQRALAYDDFDDADDVNLMPLEEVATAWSLRGLADARFSAMQERLEREMLRGGRVPGLKLVEGRSNRRWRSDGEARQAMSDLGIPAAKQFTRRLISPRTAQGLLTTKAARSELADAIIKPLGRPTMVPLDDPRPPFDLKHAEAYEDFEDDIGDAEDDAL